jgi:hypothetical protein
MIFMSSSQHKTQFFQVTMATTNLVTNNQRRKVYVLTLLKIIV